jgi:predicted DNA-binding transcriptional regulator AlpA
VSLTRRAEQQRTTPAIEPLVIDSRTLAALLQTSKSTVFRRLALGEIPKPVAQFGQQPRWSMSEIKAWIAAGMPDQRTWERMRNAQK